MDPDEIRQSAADGTLLGKLFGEFAFRSDDAHATTTAGLVDAHNGGAIDLLQLLAGPIPEGTGHDFFLGQALYCELIPDLNASAEKLMVAVEGLVRAAEQDLAANEPNRAFREWCAKSPARIDEVLGLADAGSEVAARNSVFAISAGMQIDRDRYFPILLDRLRTCTGSALLSAIVAAGRADFGAQHLQQAQEIIASLLALRDDRGDRLVQGNLRHAAFHIASQVTAVSSDAASFLDDIDVTNAEDIHACADLLWRHGKDLDLAVIDRLLAALAHLDPANKNTVDVLDLGLQKLWARRQHDSVANLLKQLLLHHGRALKLTRSFDGLSARMIDGDRLAVEDLLVQWFLTSEFVLCNNISSVFRRPLEGFEFNIDFSRFKLEDKAWAFLARKACGFFFIYPVSAASFITSLVRSAPEPIRPALVDLLVDPVLINYPGRGRRYVEQAITIKSDPALPNLREALRRHDEYMEGLRSVGRVLELHPSERQRQADWRRRNELMSDAYKSAEKKSVFRQLVQRQVLLFGNRSINYVTGPNEEKHRSETELKSVSATTEFPTMEIVDPIGLQYEIMTFRSERLA